MEEDDPIQDNLFYHIYNRGNDRARILRDDRDYLAFIGKMKSLAARHLIEVPVYALMSNHYHFLALQTLKGDLPKMMGALATSTAKRFNLEYRHIGHLFQGPYHHRSVGEDVLWYVASYIHLNPVRAGLVKDPAKWRYSNFGDLEAEVPVLKVEDNLERGKLWHGYAAYVREILRDEREQREWEVRIQRILAQDYLQILNAGS